MIRDIQKEDLKTIHNLVLKEWYYELYKHDKDVANAYVQFDVNSCLMESSFGRVAEIDGQVMGVIMGEVKNEEKVLSSLAENPMDHLMTLMSASEEVQDAIVSQYTAEKNANQQLLQTAPVDYDGGIVLFIISKEARGQGIGSKLFNNMLTYFDKHNVNHYHLYTDDSCGYEFYNKKGLRQHGAINVSPDDKDPFHYYLYDNVNTTTNNCSNE